MSRGLIGAVIAAIAVVTSTTYLFNRQHKHDEQRLNELARAVDDLEARPQVHSVIRHETRVEVQAAKSADAGAAMEAAAGSVSGAHVREPAEAAAHVASLFTNEPVVTAWATGAAAALSESIAAAGLSSNVTSVSCRSSLCRIDGTFADLQAYNHFMDELATGAHHPPGGDGMVTPAYDQSPDGRVHAVSYWVKKDRFAGLDVWGGQ